MSGQNKELVLVDHSDELIVDKDTYNGLLDTAERDKRMMEADDDDEE